MSEEMSVADACAVTDQFGRFLKGLARLQDAAALLRGADQLLAERTRQAEDLAKVIADKQAELDGLKQRCDSILADAVAAKSTATREANAITESAKQLAADTIRTARENAAAAQADADAHTARAESVKEDLKAAHNELADVQTRVTRAKAEALKTFGG